MVTNHPPTLPIRTLHCRFCNHLLLATTRQLAHLPRRSGAAQDRAVILPLERGEAEAEVEAEAETLQEEAEAEDNESASDAKDSSDADKNPASQLDTTAQSSTTQLQSTSTQSHTKHTTLLLSTTIPDRRPTLIRREDGIEKRVLLRCGRCRVLMGYYLDRVHWASTEQTDSEKTGEDRPPAVYLLPAAVVETEQMGGEGVGEKEWRAWAEGS
ncbi:hypothetical protein NUU61_009585 [Penicillium alfredii]|uniref:STEEP1 domain-containing protein n=1 Tax=Penicillium alfredii TaxID=1506179 RepID=A0A9W9EGF9_9EURO|nr:uncharacterized protein NUU61_009585 [Penicillium alfredii]KAJ5081321.1 hypothetical protein NUU61_009585 [Penicillium alfredii]